MKPIDRPSRQSLVATALVVAALSSPFFESAAREPKVNALQSPVTIADDAGIVEQIRAALRNDSVLAGNTIKVASSHGMVVLAGTVPDATHVDRAVDLARRVPGVKSVSARIGFIAPDIVKTSFPSSGRA